MNEKTTALILASVLLIAAGDSTAPASKPAADCVCQECVCPNCDCHFVPPVQGFDVSLDVIPPPETVVEVPKPVDELYLKVKAFHESGGSQWFEVGVPNTLENVTRHLVSDHGYTREELRGYDLNTLNWIHGMAHEGEVKASQPVQYQQNYQYSNCPGGVCPSPYQQPRRTKTGLLRRVFMLGRK